MADLRYDWLLEFCDREYHGCQQAEPLYANIARQLKGSTRVAKIDGTESTSLVKLFNVKAFPSYFMVRKGNMYAYPGTKLSADTADDLLAFAKGGFMQVPSAPVKVEQTWLFHTVIFLQRQVHAIRNWIGAFVFENPVLAVFLFGVFVLVCLYVRGARKLREAAQAGNAAAGGGGGGAGGEGKGKGGKQKHS
eukprot:g2632.t1